MASTALRICPLCEATCGLELTIDDDAARVTHARGDRADVFSAGYLCPKGAGFPELDNDPDRLQRPLLRRSDGFVEVEWHEAFDEVERRLTEIIERHGGPAVGVYLGNPGAHSIAGALFYPVLPFEEYEVVGSALMSPDIYIVVSILKGIGAVFGLG